MNHKQSDNKAQGDAMKIRYAVLLVMAIFVGLSLSAKVFAGNGGALRMETKYGKVAFHIPLASSPVRSKALSLCA